MVVFGASGKCLATSVDDNVIVVVVGDSVVGKVITVEEKTPLITELYCKQISPSTCVVVYGDVSKKLTVAKVSIGEENSNVTVVGTKAMDKKVTNVSLLDDNNTLLVADKSGDVYRFSLDEFTSDEKALPICGHISILTTMLQVGSVLLTADRDGKVRVSQYPKTYCVESYCLGHEEFISSVDVTPDGTHIVSGSGDGTLRVWELQSGEERSRLDIPTVEPSQGVAAIDDGAKEEKKKTKEERSQFTLLNTPRLVKVVGSTIVFALQRSNSVYTVKFDSDWHIVADSLESIDVEGTLCGTRFASETSTLWMCMQRGAGYVLVPVSVSEEGECVVEKEKEYNLNGSSLNSEEVDLGDLFHTNQDNTDEYFSRKHQRQEGKRSASNKQDNSKKMKSKPK
eukprot:m.88949 g.88949  ORF g.88949 m.88949 type:complete len:397 (-) comp12280_c0_seq1:3512-4702(-)